MGNITNNYAERSCVFEAGSSQNGDITINGNFFQGGARPASEETVNDSFSAGSHVFLSSARGTKIDFIRVVNCLYELGFFTDDKGGKISKKEVMTALGQAVNVNLSEYQNDLSRSLSDSTKLEKHLDIFDRLKGKMEEVFNNYGG